MSSQHSVVRSFNKEDARTGSKGYHDDCTVAYLRQAGVKVDGVHLADRGIRGNGHMMMLKKNNADIANVMVQWLAKLPANKK